MNQYITVKGVYENGTVRLLEVPDSLVIMNTEVMVMIPISKSRAGKKPKGIPINDFAKKINLFAIGGDAVKETEEIYND